MSSGVFSRLWRPFFARFCLADGSVSLRREMVAGLTTFSTMAYILLLNPLLLGSVGMDAGAVFVACVAVALVGSLWMGLVGNYPFGVAPGMALTVFFTYSLVLGEGVPWQQALALVACSGAVVLLLTGLQVRRRLLEEIPKAIRVAATAGIGLFLALIGLKDGGVVIGHASTLVQMAPLNSGPLWMTLFGVVLIAFLLRRRVQGALLFGILGVWGVSLATGMSSWGGGFAFPSSVSSTFFQLDFAGLFASSHLSLLVPLVLVSLLDASGAFLSLAQRGRFFDAAGALPRVTSSLYADGIASIVGAFCGTSPATVFLESSSGLSVGGRTGVVAVVVAFCFFVALFFAPMALSIPLFAVAPALIVTGAMMLREVVDLDWEDPTEYIPGFLVLVGIPFTYSIAKGIELGLLGYLVGKLISGRVRETGWLVWALALAFLFSFLF